MLYEVITGVVVDMEGFHYGQQSFGWDGHVDFDGAGSAVSVAGDLSGSDLELGLAAASLDVAVGSLGVITSYSIHYTKLYDLRYSCLSGP